MGNNSSSRSCDSNNDRNTTSTTSSPSAFSSASPMSSSRSDTIIKKHSIPSLHKGMMRQRHNSDPHKYYEVIKILGTGSLGSVCKIRKRSDQIGGSARKKVANVNICGKNILLPCIDSTTTTDDTTCFGWKFYETKNILDVHPSSPGSSSHHSNRIQMSTKSTDSSKHYKINYALKSILLNRITDKTYMDELRNEVDILKSLDHPNIVRPIETFEYIRQIFIVMELCHGGDLYSRDPYTEAQAVVIVKKILSAVAYMHRFNIMHRDLKYENILFENKCPKAEVKIIDFGLSKKYAPEDPYLCEHVGTIYTMAPQVIEGKYDFKADLWSIGVIAYMLLSSSFPFHGKKRRAIIDNIMSCNYTFKGKRWNGISDDATHFISELIQNDPKKRPTASEALNHSFLSEEKFKRRKSPVKIQPDYVRASIEEFSTYSQLKKISLMIIAYKSTPKELGGLRKLFATFDTEKNGTISYEEFQKALTSFKKYSPDELARMFDAVDIDKTGKINYTEFLAATIEALGVIEEERLAEAFDRLDSDDSGYISLQNLRELFAGEVPEEKLEQIMVEANATKDKGISYEQFLLLWDEMEESEPRFENVVKNPTLSPNLSEAMIKRFQDDNNNCPSNDTFISSKSSRLHQSH